MTVGRIELLNAPDGTIETIDKYQILIGLDTPSGTPVVASKWKRFIKRYAIGFSKGSMLYFQKIIGKWFLKGQ
jgi:hypothetical protein